MFTAIKIDTAQKLKDIDCRMEFKSEISKYGKLHLNYENDVLIKFKEKCVSKPQARYGTNIIVDTESDLGKAIRKIEDDLVASCPDGYKIKRRADPAKEFIYILLDDSCLICDQDKKTKVLAR